MRKAGWRTASAAVVFLSVMSTTIRRVVSAGTCGLAGLRRNNERLLEHFHAGGVLPRLHHGRPRRNSLLPQPLAPPTISGCQANLETAEPAAAPIQQHLALLADNGLIGVVRQADGRLPPRQGVAKVDAALGGDLFPAAKRGNTTNAKAAKDCATVRFMLDLAF